METIITPTGIVKRPEIIPIDNIKRFMCPHETIACENKDPQTGLCMIGNCDQSNCGRDCDKCNWCDLKC